MSRTTTVKSGSGHLNSAVIFARLCVVALLVCLSVQSALAQTPRTITPTDVSGTLIIGAGDNEDDYTHSGDDGNIQLRLGAANPSGGIFAIRGYELFFEDITTFGDGGAIFVSGAADNDPDTFRYTFSGGLPDSLSGVNDDDFAGKITIQNNTAGGPSGKGGGLYNLGTDIKLSYLEFFQNTSSGVGGQDGGGAIYNESGHFLFDIVEFDRNHAEKHGGAIFNKSGTLTVKAYNDTDSRTSVNFSSYQAEILPYAPPYDVMPRGYVFRAENLFSGNWAKESGGAIYNLAGNLNFNAHAELPQVTGSWDYVSNRQNPDPLNVNAYTFVAGNGGFHGYITYVYRIAANRFTGNIAQGGSGGAIFSNSGSLTFNASTVPHSYTTTGEVTGNGDTPTRSWNSITASPYLSNDPHETYAVAGDFTANEARYNSSVTNSGKGGAIYGSGTMDFSATADTATATATSLVTGDSDQASPVGGAWARVISDAKGGIFTDNIADVDGGAIHFSGTTLNFDATANTATATANSTATTNTPDNQMRYARALSESQAYVTAKGGIFTGNTAGTDNYEGQTRNYNGRGGAVFNQTGDLTFSATAQYATATANATANANNGGNGSGHANANATARAASEAVGAEFEDNRARQGGAIYTDAGSKLVFQAAIVANAEGQNAYANANPAPNGAEGSINDYANAPAGIYGGFDLDGTMPDTDFIIPNDPVYDYIIDSQDGLGFLDNSFINDPLFSDGSLSGRYGARASARSTAYGAIFRENIAAESGGAIYSNGAELEFTADNVITAAARSTEADAEGTAPLIDETSNTLLSDVLGLPGVQGDITYTTILDETIAKNKTNNTVDTAGRNWRYGISHATVDAAAALFEGNVAGKDGGAIYLTSGSTMNVTGITRFRDNVAGQKVTGDGSTTEYVGGGYGGAIFNDHAAVTFDSSIRNGITSGYSTFTGNTAERGGAIYNNDGVVSFWNDSEGGIAGDSNLLGARFGGGGLGNQAVFGGAIFNTAGGTVDLTNARFEGNKAVATIGTVTIDDLNPDPELGSGGLGGAIYNNGGIVNLYGGLFSSNTAVKGGAIYHTNPGESADATLLIDSSDFADGIKFQFNEAELGGAIYNNDLTGTLDLSHLTFDGNIAKEGGALWNVGTANIADADFINGNRAGIDRNLMMGGAIYNTADQTAIPGAIGKITFAGINLFDNNSVADDSTNQGRGGAIYNDLGTLEFTGSNTFTRNSAFEGGAIYNAGGIVDITGGIFGDTSQGLTNGNGATNGGAIYNKTVDANEAILFLENVDFRGNYSLLGGNGGAIYNDGGQINMVVTGTTTISGNKRDVDLGAIGSGTGTYESIFFAGTGNEFNIHTASGATLDMYDPMHWADGSAVTITKGDLTTNDENGNPVYNDGMGTWILRGENGDAVDAPDAAVNMNINRGTLELIPSDFDDGIAGNNVAAKIDLGTGNFTLSGETSTGGVTSPGATLVVQGAVTTGPTGTTLSTITTDASKITTAGKIDLDGTLRFDNVSFVDHYRTAQNDLDPLTGGAVLELGSNTENTIRGDIIVNLTGMVDGNLSDTNFASDISDTTLNLAWREYFDEQDGELYLIANRPGYTDPDTGSSDKGVQVFINGNQQYFERGTDGAATRFVVDADGYLKMSAGDAVHDKVISWTGMAGNGEWDESSRNWFGNGDTTARSFFTGDNVRFSNTVTNYVNETHTEVRDYNVLPEDKIIAIAQDVTVGSMSVAPDATGYVFNLGAGYKLESVVKSSVSASTGDINFGNATINLASGSQVIAGNDINLSIGTSGTVNGATVTMKDDSTFRATGDININGNTAFGDITNKITTGTVIEATNINFNAGVSNFVFDVGAATGVNETDPVLTFDGNTVTALGSRVGSGKIDVYNLDTHDPIMSPIILIDTGTDNTVTAAGRLFLDGTEVHNIRGGADDMTGLGTDENDSQLLLVTVDADALSDNLYWTGEGGSDEWDSTTENWSGTVSDGTSEMHVWTFLTGDDVIFADQTDDQVVDPSKKTVRPTVDVTVGSMTVTGSGYRLVSDMRGGGTTITATDGITFNTAMDFEFILSGADVTNAVLNFDGVVNTTAGTEIGSGSIYITNSNLREGESVLLVSTETANSIVATGDLYINGEANTIPNRGAGETMYTLETANTGSQLFLHAVNAGQNTEFESPLYWTGTSNTEWNITEANWSGEIERVHVSTFLHNDHVMFADTVDNVLVTNRTVDLTEDVTVNTMRVEGSGYEFNLARGGIHATGDINLGDSTVIVSLIEDDDPETTDTFVMTNTIYSEGTITFEGTTISVDAEEIAPEVFREGKNIVVMQAVEGFAGAAIEEVEMETGNPLLVGSFYREGNYGYVRLGLYDFLDSVYDFHHNTTEAAAALNKLAGAKWGDEQWQGIMDNTNNTNRAIHQLRGTELVADALGAAMWSPWEITHRRMRTTRDDSGWNTWGEGYYRTGHVSSDDNAMSYDFSRGGSMIGADFGANRYWHIGGAFGYGLPGVENEFGKIDGDDLTVGMYSKINFFDTAAVTTFFGYGYQSYEMERHDFAGTHKGDFSGDALYASVEFAKPIQSQWGVILPLIALDHQTAWTKRFNETGNSTWNQAVSGASMERTMVRFGVDGKWQSAGSVALMSRLQAGFLLDGDEYATVQTHFPGSTASMSLRGSEIGALQVNAGISATGEYRQRYNWFFDLDGYLTGRSYAVQGQLGLSTRW